MSVGLALKKLRIMRNMTQSEVGDILRLDTSSVGRSEMKAKQTIHVRTIEKYARAMRVPAGLVYLLMIDPNGFPEYCEEFRSIQKAIVDLYTLEQRRENVIRVRKRKR